ncbi:hypothetical protein [Pseudoroseicyclus aestuarii]|nr:hypothetical protein [Pseudoroseicyclus aestuarii]
MLRAVACAVLASGLCGAPGGEARADPDEIPKAAAEAAELSRALTFVMPKYRRDTQIEGCTLRSQRTTAPGSCHWAGAWHWTYRVVDLRAVSEVDHRVSRYGPYIAFGSAWQPAERSYREHVISSGKYCDGTTREPSPFSIFGVYLPVGPDPELAQSIARYIERHCRLDWWDTNESLAGDLLPPAREPVPD